ncbi:MAG TPA: iron ABC transporter substrate-binding protein, partial [Paraburkholderia sp.]|nr:iron ABC transporter substrate-binding protein [Paraburkholderia sp.]
MAIILISNYIMSILRFSLARRPLTRAAGAFAACVALTFGAVVTSTGACAATQAPASHAAQSVTDLAGRTVAIPAEPHRILLGESRLLTAVALLEGQHPLARIVGWQGDLPTMDPQTYDAYAKKFPEIKQIPLIGK